MVEVQVDTLHKVFGDLLYTPKLHPNEIAHHHAVCKTSKMLTEQCRQTWTVPSQILWEMESSFQCIEYYENERWAGCAPRNCDSTATV